MVVYYTHFEITGGPWLALTDAIYSRIAPLFALNRIFFAANEEATLKTKQPSRFQGLFKITDQIAEKILQLLFPKLLLFPPKRWMNFQTGSVRYCINKIFELTKSFIWEFQNGCNKVVIEPRVVQFWSEIILVISNRTRAARSFDFEITQMISAQIALHSGQLPLSITKRSNC